MSLTKTDTGMKQLRVCDGCEGVFAFTIQSVSRGQSSPCCYGKKNHSIDHFRASMGREPRGPWSKGAKELAAANCRPVKRQPEADLMKVVRETEARAKGATLHDRWVNVDGVEPDQRAQYVGAEIACRLFRGRRGHGSAPAGSRVFSRAQLAAAISIAYQLGKEGR